MPRVVVLGTGTGVGKTYFTAALAVALRASPRCSTVVALKPVETGVRGNRAHGAPPPGSDAALLESVSRGEVLRPHPLFGFLDPISPHLAAERERARALPKARRGTASVSISAIRRWASTDAPPAEPHRSVQRLAIRGIALPAMPWQLVETAGGAFSPLTRRTTNVDLARTLDPAVLILVAPDSLGVLHDARATLLALEASFRPPDFVVLSAARDRDSATGLNAAEFPRVGLPRPIAVLDRQRTAAAALAPLVRALVRRSADDG